MSRRFRVLQHIACEPSGAFEDELRAWGGELERVEVDEGEPLPDWREFDAIIAMGGPMGAYEDDRFPWLAPEKRLIAEAVHAGLPYWGVCLGAQLLAASLSGGGHSRSRGRGPRSHGRAHARRGRRSGVCRRAGAVFRPALAR